MNDLQTRDHLLATAAGLFYERGIQAVGIDEIRTAAGTSLRRLYQCYPSKERLVEAYLERRDRTWQASLESYVDRHAEPRQRVLVVLASSPNGSPSLASVAAPSRRGRRQGPG